MEDSRMTSRFLIAGAAAAALFLVPAGGIARDAPAKAPAGSAAKAAPADDSYLFSDSHFHLTNYVQQGTDIRTYLEIMGDKIGRSTLFGIPL